MKEMLYKQLTNFLLTQLPESYKFKFYSWVENGKLINQGKKVTERGIEIAHIDYDAILLFEEFPFKKISANYLMALIQLWLEQYDDLRYLLDNFEVTFDLDILDDSTANLSFTIGFREVLTAVLDEAGQLKIDGEYYRLDDIEVNQAENISVSVNKSVFK